MRDGFIKVAAGTPKIKVADCEYNAGQIIALMREAAAQGVKVLALPELCVTGYTCGDLFLQETLLRGAEDALSRILEETSTLDMLTAVGLPVRSQNELYNCAAVISKGRILGLVPKNHIPNYGEFYEARWFTSGVGLDSSVTLCGQYPDLYSSQLFVCEEMPNLTVGVELCEDLWAVAPPSTHLAALGATVILNLSASDEVAGKSAYRRSLVAGQSARLLCGYVYADAGEGESTTDLVFAGHNIIAENGAVLAETRFQTGLTVSEIDVDRLAFERRKMNTYDTQTTNWVRATFSLCAEETKLTRPIGKNPFVPEDHGDRQARCEEIFTIAALPPARWWGCPAGWTPLWPCSSPPGPSICWAGPGVTSWPSPCPASAPPAGPSPTPRCWPSASGLTSVRWTLARHLRERPGPGADPGADGPGQPAGRAGHRHRRPQ